MNLDSLWKHYKTHGLKSVEDQEVSSELMNRFLSKLIHHALNDDDGRNHLLWAELQKHPKIYLDSANFERKVKKARVLAASLMQAKDPLVFERWGIERTEIPQRQLHLNHLKPNISEQGMHIVHGRIGSGKFEGIIKEDVQRYGEGARLLVITPNQNDVYETARKLGLGWNHYHAFGKDAESVKKAIASFDRLVICAGSLSKFSKFNEYINTFDCIYVDEITQLLKSYGKKYTVEPNSKQSVSASFRESLETLFDLISHAKRSLFLSADINERFTLDILGRTASECEQRIKYYRNNTDYAEGSNWTFFKEETDLAWQIVDRINAGHRFWGTVDFADTNKPEFKAFVKFLKRHCPNKKIQAFTADDLKNDFKGKLLQEQGLKAYIIDQTDQGALDGIITTTWARHNVSLMFDDDKYSMDFSFGIHRHINDPDDAIQGHRRDRKIVDHLICVQNNQTFPIYRNALIYRGELRFDLPPAMEKNYLEDARIGEKMLHATETAYCFDRAANRANKRWLTKLHLSGMGARILEAEISTVGRAEEYLAFRTDYLESVIDVEKEVENWESEPFKRQKLFSSFTQWDQDLRTWTQVKDDGSIFPEELADIKEAIDLNIAENLRLILSMDVETRIAMDLDPELYYKETGILLDALEKRLFPNGSFGNLAKWYLTASAGSLWVGLIPEKESKEITQLIRDNYREYYRLVLGSGGQGMVRSFEDFATKIIGKNLELEIWTKVAREKRSEWKNDLFNQYYKEYGGRVIRSMKVAEKYEVIGAILRNKIKLGLSASFSDPELRMLDTMKDVVKIRRPDRPILSRIWELYHKTSYMDGSLLHVQEDELEQQIKSPPEMKIL